MPTVVIFCADDSLGVLFSYKFLYYTSQANEIAFINTLEAQNKRHDIMSKHQTSEARLADIQVM